MRAVVLLAIFASLKALAQQQQPAQPTAPAPQPPAQEQAEQPPPPPRHVALRVVGSHVRSPGGDKLGRIEEVLVNRTSGAIEYAVLAPNFPTNESRLVPVPWSILNHAWDQSRAGGPAGANQIFIANLEPARLAKAPSLDRTRVTGIDPALAAANNFFGVPAGGAGIGSETVAGAGASQPAIAQPGAIATTAEPLQAADENAIFPNTAATNNAIRVPHEPAPGVPAAPSSNRNLQDAQRPEPSRGDPSAGQPPGPSPGGPPQQGGAAPARPTAPPSRPSAPPATAPGR